MRILVVYQGPYGERILNNVRQHAPSEWAIQGLALPRGLPPFVDDPDDFLPEAVPESDLLIAVGESSGAAQLITDLAQRCRARAVIAPIDNSAWMPIGLANQLREGLSRLGITSVFPRPFCSLSESGHGYGRSAECYDDQTIAAFAARFGRPAFTIQVDPATKLIAAVEVTRNSACGSAYHVAQRLPGMSPDDASVKAGLILHHFPCLCSMNKEWIDDRLYDTLMHVSGYIVNEDIGEQLKPYLTPPQYFTPPGYVE